MKDLEYQNWYLNRKSKEANILYERLSKLATGKDVILEQESKISQPTQSADKSKQAEQLIKLPQAQSSLIKNTNKIFGIDNGTTEGKQFNNVLSDFYGSFFKDMAASPDPKKPEPSANSIDLAKKVVESYAKYVSGEFSSAGKEISSLSKAKASGETIYKDIKRRLSNLFENASNEDKILLKEFLPALGAGVAALATGIAQVIGAIITAIGPAIAALGFGGVGVIAFGYFMYKVMSNPKVDSAVDKMLGAVDTGAEAAKKIAGAAESGAGAAQNVAQGVETQTVESIACRKARKWVPGMVVKQGEYLKHTRPGKVGKIYVSEVAEVNPDNNTEWNPGRTFECSVGK